MGAITPHENARRMHTFNRKPQAQRKMYRYPDKIARGECIAQIQLQYDYRCNMKCEHCYVTSFDKKDRKLTINDVRVLSTQADAMGLAQFTITGGEPTIFPDLDDLVDALQPEKFYLALDTNGLKLDPYHMKAIGVDKIQLSFDPWHGELPMRALEETLDAGLRIILVTVVTKSLLYSEEFIEILEIGKRHGVGNFISLAKPVGSWCEQGDLCGTDELLYLESLRENYDVFTHLTPSYGLDLGCISIKRQFSITAYGDVTPCPYIHYSLGSIFDEPLADIVDRAMKIPVFANARTCLSGVDREFMAKHHADTEGKALPVPWEYE